MSPVPAGTAVQRMLDLQSHAGNQAVVEMLGRPGQPAAERHRHGPACGHRPQSSPVQRSTGSGTVARAEEEDGHVHDGARDTAPEGQSALLAAAMNSSSESLPASVVAKAGAFYRNDGFSTTRVHRDAVAQRATAALGAQAMTVGNHIFLSAGAGADEKLIGHELSHVDKNLKGVPETGHGNGAGVTVTDPRQHSEQAAERDGNAYASGQATAPSAVARQTVANGSHGTVQRMPGDGEQAPGGGSRIAIQDQAPELSAEDHIASLPEDSDQEVYLKRGVTPTQKKYLVKEVIRGSFISLPKMLREPDENATKPDPEHVKGYVNQTRNDDTAKLIEFSTDSKIAAQFASESRFGYVLTIRIKRKYLAKGATGGENGWIAKQGAPYEIVAVDQRDSTREGISPLTEEELRAVVKKEEMAEFLLSVQETDALATYLGQFQGPAKVAEMKRIMALRASELKD
ncbi:DUF4157 domain-containing protein [Streptomyces sp. NPDC093970]|uniref:eCIS core domain-containing protein n=1 Tax=Streptomyces sp. NPDC093970 TaxID=3155076 RepID=UPI00341941ED